MFRFTALELVHWDYWERVMLPLDESIITIVGPNGSGKTTLLDAMRTVLALNTSRKRSYPTYVQHSNRPYAWLRAVVTNQRDHRGRRPFFPLTTDQVTLACRVIRRSGEWQRQYRIEPGDVGVQELSAQEERFLGVQEYRHRLTAGGLSQAVLRVLSLEQGATDKLCELSPRELLDLVYDVFGDKETLDEYQRARVNQLEAAQELQELALQVDRLESQVTALSNRVALFQRYQNLLAAQKALETVRLPQAQYVAQVETLRKLYARIRSLRTQVQERRKNAESLTQQWEEARAAVAAAHSEEEACHTRLMAIQAQLVEYHRQRAVLEHELELFKQMEQQASQVAPDAVAPLQKALEELVDRRGELRWRLEEIRRALKEMEDVNRTGGQERIRLDPFVEAFHRLLLEAEIPHRLFYEAVEIRDTSWQLAIESLLRAHRYVVLLQRPEDRWRAWELGETHRYRYFIVADRGQTHVPAPLWLRPQRRRYGPRSAGLDSPQSGGRAARRPGGRWPALALRERPSSLAMDSCGNGAVADRSRWPTAISCSGWRGANSRPSGPRTRVVDCKRRPVRCRSRFAPSSPSARASSAAWRLSACDWTMSRARQTIPSCKQTIHGYAPPLRSLPNIILQSNVPLSGYDERIRL